MIPHKLLMYNAEHPGPCMDLGVLRRTRARVASARPLSWQEWEAQKQVNTPALCAKVLNNVVAGVRRDPAAAPAIPRDGIMAMRAAGMRAAGTRTG